MTDEAAQPSSPHLPFGGDGQDHPSGPAAQNKIRPCPHCGLRSNEDPCRCGYANPPSGSAAQNHEDEPPGHYWKAEAEKLRIERDVARSSGSGIDRDALTKWLAQRLNVPTYSSAYLADDLIAYLSRMSPSPQDEDHKCQCDVCKAKEVRE